jgi:membrane protein implicated in regulation of membrane protease activity
MQWWGWLVLGALLLAAEMFVIDAQFYLVFIGAAAIIVGLFGVAGVALSSTVEWLLFAALSLVAMIAFRRRVYELARGRVGKVEERLTVGDRVHIPHRLQPGHTCRVSYKGSTWDARNVDASELAAGTDAVIASIDGLTLQVKAD